MWQYKNTDELYHAGVKGMKWGVRKAGIAPTEKRKRSPVDGPTTVPGPRKKRPWDMTGPNDKMAPKHPYKQRLDKVLDTNKRHANKQQSEKGKTATTAVLATLGTMAVTTAATAGGLYLLGRKIFQNFELGIGGI